MDLVEKLLEVQPIKSPKFGAFPAASIELWNNLPYNIKNSVSGRIPETIKTLPV